jgi:hypothetical protein
MIGKRNILVVISLITAIIFIGCENKNVNENKGSNVIENKSESTCQDNKNKNEVDKNKGNEIKTENKEKIIAFDGGETPSDIHTREVENTSNETAYGYLIGEDPLNITDISNKVNYNTVSIDGISIDYPSFLEVSVIPGSQKGIAFKSRDKKVEFFTSYMYLTEDSSPEKFANSNIYNDKDILYKNYGEDWYAISYKENDTVYYSCGKLKNDTIYIFDYSYPKEYEDIFGDIINRSYKTFKVSETR